MKLIEKLENDKKLLKKFSNIMYSLTKDAASVSFVEYLEDEGVTIEQWEKFKEWLSDNGLDTYV